MKKIILLSLILSGCASVPLTEAEKSVRILRKTDAPASCKEIGKVFASGLASLSEEGREDDLKRATHKAGGDTVTIDRRDANESMFGTAFKCS